MKKRVLTLLLIVICMLSGCGVFEKTCKADGCEETTIYEDGYCKTHYYVNVGDTLLKEIFNKE